MASISQLVSEIAHSVKQENNIAARRAIKLSIIQLRNELIRKSFSNHNYTDKILQQRFKLSLIDVPDGDLYKSESFISNTIKRTSNKVPRPVRLINNLPFHSVRTTGVTNPIEIAFVKEASAKYYNYLPGMCPAITYDYINEYLYINIPKDNKLKSLGAIIVESVFEYPHLIPIETIEGKYNIDSVNDDNEFLLPEDMISSIKKMVLETWNIELGRLSNEIPPLNVVR